MSSDYNKAKQRREATKKLNNRLKYLETKVAELAEIIENHIKDK